MSTHDDAEAEAGIEEVEDEVENEAENENEIPPKHIPWDINCQECKVGKYAQCVQYVQYYDKYCNQCKDFLWECDYCGHPDRSQLMKRCALCHEMVCGKCSTQVDIHDSTATVCCQHA